MTDRKIFLSDAKETILTCPKCEYSTVKDVSMYKDLEQSARVKCKCKCGHVYHVILERRQYYRKAVHLPGLCILSAKQELPMIVKDISRTGLKIEVNDLSAFRLGQKVMVEFNLDDEKISLIRKAVIIHAIADDILGAEFCSVETGSPFDAAIRYYMFR